MTRQFHKRLRDRIAEMEAASAKRNPKTPAPPPPAADKPITISQWIQTNLRIRSKTGEIVPFYPWPAQKLIWDSFDADRAAGIPIRYIILKPRQIGCTTAICAYFYALIATITNRTAQTLAHKADSARKIFRHCRRFHQYRVGRTDDDLVGKKVHRSNLEFQHPHDSDYSVHSAYSNAIGRGETIQYVHLSEADFYPEPEELMDSLIQCVPQAQVTADTAFALESTANRPGGFFHKMKGLAEDQDSQWKFLFLPWHKLDPSAAMSVTDPDTTPYTKKTLDYAYEHQLNRRQRKWVHFTLTNQCRNQWDRFHREYPATPELAFQFTGYQWFPPDRISQPEEPLTIGVPYAT